MGKPGTDDAARFEQLYREHGPRVIGYLARRLPADLVPDAAAETFGVAWRRLDRVPEAPLPWLLAVARRVAANERRSQRRRAALGERMAAQPSLLAEAETPAPVVEVLASLSEREQEVLLLAAWDGLSSAEAAAVLGCSEVAFRLRLHRARRKLAAQLEREQRNNAKHCSTLQPEETL